MNVIRRKDGRWFHITYTPNNGIWFKGNYYPSANDGVDHNECSCSHQSLAHAVLNHTTPKIILYKWYGTLGPVVRTYTGLKKWT